MGMNNESPARGEVAFCRYKISELQKTLKTDKRGKNGEKKRGYYKSIDS